MGVSERARASADVVLVCAGIAWWGVGVERARGARCVAGTGFMGAGGKVLYDPVHGHVEVDDIALTVRGARRRGFGGRWGGGVGAEGVGICGGVYVVSMLRGGAGNGHAGISAAA